jgi:hypothetical protein
LEAPRGVFTQALVTLNPAFALNLRAMWEATNNRWNQWVLNYSQAKQLNLLRNLGFESPSWEDLSYVLIGIVVLASLAGAAWTLWDRRRQDPWLRLYHRATLRLQRAGLVLPANTPPRQMAMLLMARIPDTEAHPELAALCDWLLRLEAWRYSGRHAAKQSLLNTLRREFGQLHWPKKLPTA